MDYWVHSIDPFLFRFPEGFPLEGIRWYGIAYLLGFLSAFGLLVLYRKKQRLPLSWDATISLITWLIIGVLVGGRLGYVFLYDIGIFADPLRLIRVWEGGMASHGGFIGVAIVLILFARHHKVPPFALSDVVVTLAPLGICFGRIANFINGNLWGRITDVSWAVIFPNSAPYAAYPVEWIPPRHPSQLYAALLEGLLLFLFIQWRFWKGRALPFGRITGEFLIAYACARILGEFWREPDASLILGMSRGQFYSIFLILGGLLILWLSRRWYGNREAPSA